MGQLVVQPGNPGHEADHRSDDRGPVTPENSGEGGEEETGRVLVLDHGHPTHDLPHPLHLLDTPEEAVHQRLVDKVEDKILKSEEIPVKIVREKWPNFTWGLKYTETQTIRMLATFQSLKKESAGGNPSNMLDMREPARQEINIETQEARGDCLKHRDTGEVWLIKIRQTLHSVHQTPV